MSTPTASTAHRSQIGRWIAGLSWTNLFLLMLVSLLLFAVSEDWWLSSAMTYAPRLPYLAPTVVLLAASLIWDRASLAVNLISVTMVTVPIMGLTLPIARWISPASSGESGPTVKILSCNIQDFRPDFTAVVTEIGRVNPDVVVFQDARSQSKLLQQYFESWHIVRDGEFFAASRHPLKLVSVGHFESFDRDAILHCELELPTTKVNLFNVHQMTPRHGLPPLDISSPITQRGSGRLTQYIELRGEEAGAIREFVETHRGSFPTLIAGDFNMPCESSLYQRHWFGFQNAFNLAGTGYGYSFPCTRQYCWPAGLPWMRLDHILTDETWSVQTCLVGQANGSDHRLIAATIRLK